MFIDQNNASVANESTAGPPFGLQAWALAGELGANGPQRDTDRSEEAELLAQVLDALSLGVWLLKANGRIVMANGTAQALCKGPEGLCVERGCLKLAAAAQQQRLLGALTKAAQGHWSMLTIRVGGKAYPLTVVPLGTHLRAPALQGNAVGTQGAGPVHALYAGSNPLHEGVVGMAILGCQQAGANLALNLFCREHSITPAEQQVLGLLFEGYAPTQVADRLAVSLTTVRSQISSIRQKSGSKSLNQLMCSLAALPPLATRATRAASQAFN